MDRRTNRKASCPTRMAATMSARRNGDRRARNILVPRFDASQYGCVSVDIRAMRADLSLRHSCSPELIKTPVIYCEVKAVFTNTVPVDAYRGAGRPEATYLLERLVDAIAYDTGIDRVDIRRRNFIRADAFLYQTPVALQYDSGDYQTTLAVALKNADWAGFEARRSAAKARGKLRGIGISTYLEACGIAPSAVVGSLGARERAYEVATAPRASNWYVPAVHRHAQPWPGPRPRWRNWWSSSLAHRSIRSRLCTATPRKSCSAWGIGGRSSGGRRLGDASKADGQDHRQGGKNRGAYDGGLGRGYRVRQQQHLSPSPAPISRRR